jgi:hypothetical protein
MVHLPSWLIILPIVGIYNVLLVQAACSYLDNYSTDSFLFLALFSFLLVDNQIIFLKASRHFF